MRATAFPAIGKTAAEAIVERWAKRDIKSVYAPGVWREMLVAFKSIQCLDPSPEDVKRCVRGFSRVG